MPVIRVNAIGDRAGLHGSPQPVAPCLAAAAQGCRSVLVMIHGYQYQPGVPGHCPHRFILSLDRDAPPRLAGWLPRMELGRDAPGAPLVLAFGWEARGALWQAYRQARTAGRVLARLLAGLRRQDPARPVHLLAHSLGSEPALEALHHLPAGAVARVVLMSAASYRSRALAALATPAGGRAELINVTSRENDPFDFLFERLIEPPRRGDRAIGAGLVAPNAVTLQIDCPDTLRHLRRFGARIGSAERRVCHWSSYTRPGALQFYRDLLHRPEVLTLEALRQGLPGEPAPRWSRLGRFASRPAAAPAGRTAA